MRIGYGDNKIKEVKNVEIVDGSIIADFLIFDIDNEKETKRIYNSLLVNGFADLRSYEHREFE
jgi:hypothetical protein